VIFLVVAWGAAAWAESPDAPLLETYWKAMKIGEAPVTVPSGQREPHLVLTTKGNRVRGFTGCNRLMGVFAQDGDSISFKGLATTKMACSPPLNNQESAFLRALEATTRLHIAGDSLELRDASGKVLMRLEARYLR
jgi:heat shock protein HslJ